MNASQRWSARTKAVVLLLMVGPTAITLIIISLTGPLPGTADALSPLWLRVLFFPGYAPVWAVAALLSGALLWRRREHDSGFRQTSRQPGALAALFVIVGVLVSVRFDINYFAMPAGEGAEANFVAPAGTARTTFDQINTLMHSLSYMGQRVDDHYEIPADPSQQAGVIMADDKALLQSPGRQSYLAVLGSWREARHLEGIWTGYGGVDGAPTWATLHVAWLAALLLLGAGGAAIGSAWSRRGDGGDPAEFGLAEASSVVQPRWPSV